MARDQVMMYQVLVEAVLEQGQVKNAPERNRGLGLYSGKYCTN